ncbi:MAG: alanine dehydrogenase, partial [bacterium]
MKIGIPREIKDNEYRVGIVPSGVEELVSDGHEIMIQEGAGLGSGITDEDFVSGGAVILPDAGTVWGAADLVMKVKEPLVEEYDLLKDNQILFTFLHLAPLPDLVDVLLDRGIRSVAYETIQLPDGSLPLLAPM